jgi:hypothetical protein
VGRRGVAQGHRRSGIALLIGGAGRALDRGDFDGWHVWARIRLAIDAMQAPRRGEPN